MEKKIFEKTKRKECHIHGEAEATPFETKVMNISITIAFFAFIINFFLFAEGITPFYSFFIIMGIPIVFLLIFTFKHFVINKEPMHYESYDIKTDVNAFTGKNEVEISNYKEKMINDNKKEK